MNKRHRTRAGRGFTLIEMMVVVAIIALLVSALLPAFSAVRTRARFAQAQSMFTALEAGLQLFRGESALGALPPSASDNPANRQWIANPKLKNAGNGGQDPVRISGAHLLAHAMIGADGLGTPGFKDTGSKGDRDGLWWNDTHDNDKGIYELDPATLEPVHPRYGGAGYVDNKMRERMKSLNDLANGGVIQNLPTALPDTAKDELLFVDPWNTPVLYFRANRAAVRMVSAKAVPGVYRQEDNGLITGTVNGTFGFNFGGLDFGPGKVGAYYHATADAIAPGPDPKTVDVLNDTTFDDSFARFILDPSVKVRHTPINSDSYLMISAGVDARYGTNDDVTNWTRILE